MNVNRERFDTMPVLTANANFLDSQKKDITNKNRQIKNDFYGNHSKPVTSNSRQQTRNQNLNFSASVAKSVEGI